MAKERLVGAFRAGADEARSKRDEQAVADERAKFVLEQLELRSDGFIALIKALSTLPTDGIGRTLQGRLYRSRDCLLGDFRYGRGDSSAASDHYRSTCVMISSPGDGETNYEVFAGDGDHQNRARNGFSLPTDPELACRDYEGPSMEQAQQAFLGWLGRTAPERGSDVVDILEGLYP